MDVIHIGMATEGAPQRRRWRFRYSLRTLMIVVLSYGLLWTLTATWGERDIYTYGCEPYELVGNLGPRLSYNPYARDEDVGSHGPKPPWHYLSTVAPCPFILKVDSVFEPGCGIKEDFWVVWFFGYWCVVKRGHWTHWD